MNGLRFTVYGLRLSFFRIMLVATFFAAFSRVYAQVIPSTQPEKTDTRKGNQQFLKDNYTDAEADYKKALDKKEQHARGHF